MTDGFLSRWARRKSGKQDEPVESSKEVVQPITQINVEGDQEEKEAPPPVTLEDVEKIDRFAPDFSAFMKADVDPAVQQAALKKMFTDPHFNVMDGLDIYIDDYSKPDPLPPGMLERMVQGDMLNLFPKQSGSEEVLGEAEAESTPSELQKPALADFAQTDLTSTQVNTPNQSIHLNEVLVEPDKKKT